MHAISHLALAVIAASSVFAASPPNIIFILSDDRQDRPGKKGR